MKIGKLRRLSEKRIVDDFEAGAGEGQIFLECRFFEEFLGNVVKSGTVQFFTASHVSGQASILIHT